jgi:hypothetical protein
MRFRWAESISGRERNPRARAVRLARFFDQRDVSIHADDQSARSEGP